MLRRLLAASMLLATTTTWAEPAAAPHAASGAEGLQPGTTAPQFMLPIVNDFPAAKKWGPGKWTALPAAADGKGAPEQKKLVVMSFFATYCEPCKKEMPELARLYDAYKDQGLGVMLVSIDKGDQQRDEIVRLASENHVAFPVMHDRFQVVARRYAAERLPYMLLLDSAGVIRVAHVGYTDEVKANLENEIRAGLGLPPLPAASSTTTRAASGSATPAKTSTSGGKKG